MSTITKEFTKEQLQQIEAAAKEVMWPVVWSEKKAREHLSEKITPKVVLELARIALASLEAEAVCYLTWHQGFRAPDDCEEYVVEAKPGDKSCDGSPAFPVYAAPPAPVSMKDHQICELVNELRDIAVEYHGTQQLRERIARTVRAAMLQGADGYSPDGWVACSERMPETMVSVLVTGTWFHHAVAFWDGLSWCDLDFEPPVTHWMPLPAAPQQEAQ